MSENKLNRIRIEVKGIVQGVGFRPFIHRLVRKYGFTGWVRNTSAGAELELEGEADSLCGFVEEIKSNHPVLALIEAVEVYELQGLKSYSSFNIVESSSSETVRTLVSPDVSICPDCLREMLDPADRRYKYPFINCTNCGPRFTIIKSVPYDRAATSMAEFPMCDDCSEEFHDIENRRYHAQPDCCRVCGPKVSFYDGAEQEIFGDAIENAQAYLKDGKIIAVKGLGGMHLACDAFDPEPARLLRCRKQRDEKPFAIMCRDISCVGRFCEVTPDEEKALLSHRRPIVLLRKKERGSCPHLSENNDIGVMLPYTPLHYLLMGDDIDALIMTSANLSDTPIMYKNDEAFLKLRGIADGFLLHDREIQTRCDDSLIRVVEGREYPLRRSRGYMPFPVLIPEVKTQILACGAEQKASFCLSKSGYVFPSQHIGDLKNIETLKNYEGQIAHFERLFDVSPSAVACDMHPDYLSTAYALERAAMDDIPLVQVQHHHAHMAACMADNSLGGECLGLIWDGTGYGTDGTIWGGELLSGGYESFSRIGSIMPVPLPGGDAAVEEIWRAGFSLLKAAGVPTEGCFDGRDTKTVEMMLDKKLNCPLSSGMGRLFDGVAAILGIRETCSYEGQGAILLEAAAENDPGSYHFGFYDENGVDIFDWRPMILEIATEKKIGLSVGKLAARFMNTLIEMAEEQCLRAAEETGLRRVVLSGGVFQNVYLLNHLAKRLRTKKLEVFTHSRVSTNDEGLSLGQIMVCEYSQRSNNGANRGEEDVSCDPA
ncbi:MAG: carbamoyltransferase HypF [Clostridia bacterium]|nr:carbamoyltransferase HypF [Clostridia bacterium]